MGLLSVIPAKAGIYRCALDESALDPRWSLHPYGCGDDTRVETYGNSPMTISSSMLNGKIGD